MPPRSRIRSSYSLHHWSICASRVFCRDSRWFVGWRYRSVRSTRLPGQTSRQRLARPQADLPGIDQQGLGRIEPETLDVELLHVVGEAVVLRRDPSDRTRRSGRSAGPACRASCADRRPPRGASADLRRLPLGQQPLDPLDEMLRRLAGRQGNHAVGMVLHPFEKPHRRQLAQQGKVLDDDRGNLLRRRIKCIERRGPNGDLLHRRQNNLRTLIHLYVHTHIMCHCSVKHPLSLSPPARPCKPSVSRLPYASRPQGNCMVTLDWHRCHHVCHGIPRSRTIEAAAVSVHDEQA